MTTTAITPLRQRMIEDMYARKLCAGTQRGHIRACKRFAGFLKRSPDTATLDFGSFAADFCRIIQTRFQRKLALPSVTTSRSSQPARCTVTVFTELQLGAMSSYSITPSRTARCDSGDRNRAARGQRGTKS
jgi:hypothetical protein